MQTTFTSTNQLVDTSYYTPMQLSLPIDLIHQFKKSDPIHTFMKVMGGVNLSKFINSKRVGRQEYDDAMMLRIVLFAFMENITSLRGIAKACCVDTRFIWLARGQRPSHMAFQRFISEKLTDSIQVIFTTLNKHLIETQNINTKELFIDGTKIEANARKFSFVWKNSILKNQANLMVKISKTIKTYNQAYQTYFPIFEFYKPQSLVLLLSDVGNKIRRENIGFVYGKGTRKDPLQRYYEAFMTYHIKALEYEEHLKICGERSSYSKTDHDATFMHGKEDYYNKTGIFKPYYNLQIGVSDGFILEAKTFPNPTDTKTFIPFLKNYEQRYGFYPKRPVADAGYGSFENYLFCISHEMELWQKYNQYTKEKEATFGKKLYNIKNMIKQDTVFTSRDGKNFVYSHDTVDSRSGTRHIRQIYTCEDYTQSDNDKGVPRQVSYNPCLNELQEEAKRNLDSDEGIRLRIQRSIQAEGAFGDIKANMEYTRLHRRGAQNVESEIVLISIGYNLRKVHNKQFS